MHVIYYPPNAAFIYSKTILMTKFFTLVLFTSLYTCTYAQTIHTWQGPSTGGSWTNAANWDNGVPTSPTDEIVFDGAISTLVGGVITITDVQQTNSLFSYDRLRVINNAIVTLSSASNSYLYFDKSLLIETGSRVNIGGTSAKLFEIGATLSSTVTINGTLDLQGVGNSSNATNFVPTTASFASTVVAIIRGTIILSGLNAKISPNGTTPSFENGSQLIVTRDGGFISKANYKNGSIIKIQGVVNAVPSFTNSANYEGVIEWNCPGQLISGSAAIILPTNSFSYYDSLLVNNTGNNRSIRLATNPNNNYIKNIIINGGTLEFSSPGGSGIYNHKVDTLVQNGGILIGNAPGVTGFDNAFEPDTLSVTGKFIQTGGTFDFSTRTPNNTTPNASFVLQVAGDVSIGGTIKLSKPTTSPNCALVFNGIAKQNFSVTGTFASKIKTVINNASIVSGVSLATNVMLPDSLVFKKGYIFLNDFDLTNPLPVQFGTTDFTKHAVTNGQGYFIQKKIKTALVGLPIAATTTSFNPLSLNVLIDSMDIAAKVDIGLNPTIVFPNKAVNRTWRIKPVSAILSNIGIAFGYSDIGVGLGDGNPGFSYTDNNEVGLYDGANWQVISGPITPIGPNPYAVSHILLSSLLTLNTATPLAVGNVSAITPVGKFLQISAVKINNDAQIKWTVSDITDVANFIIFKSKDGTNFTAIATVNTSFNQVQYSFVDNNIQSGTDYYRIKMVGLDGSIKISTIVAVANTKSQLVLTALVPNVVKNNTILIVSANQSSNFQFIITDVLGSVVYKSLVKLVPGVNNIYINCTNFSNGQYQLVGWANGIKLNVLKFVKH